MAALDDGLSPSSLVRRMLKQLRRLRLRGEQQDKVPNLPSSPSVMRQLYYVRHALAPTVPHHRVKASTPPHGRLFFMVSPLCAL